MGTRHLIAVYDRNGTLRVAQYGQWDGYPSGNGLEVLHRLPGLKSEQFEQLTWASEEDVNKTLKAVSGKTDGWLTMEQAERYAAQFPQFCRDTSAKVLDLILTNPTLKLQDAENFAADSLFCEWAYVIDFKKKKFEVYQGFNKKKPVGRFKHLDDPNEEYRPVTRIATWHLSVLPTEEQFLKLENEE